MSDPRTRVDQLIALALDSASSPEEARNAAMVAVRIIREQKLLVAPSPFARPSTGGHGAAGGFADWVPPPTGGATYPNPRRVDFDEKPKSAQQRAYEEGWERIWREVLEEELNRQTRVKV